MSSSSAIERVFLPSTGHCLPQAAQFLVERAEPSSAGARLDFSAFLVVLPGARAGRRLIEILAREAEKRGRVLVPPEIITAGSLAETLAVAPLPLADSFRRKIVWAKALRATKTIGAVVAAPPQQDDLCGWFALGGMADSLNSELAAGVRSFKDAAELLAEPDRWTALADAYELYLDELQQQGFEDPWRFQVSAASGGALACSKHVVLIGCSDLNPVHRELLRRIQGRVTALVHAPDSQAALFDQFGSIVPSAWSAEELKLDPERLRFADGPAEQAEEIYSVLRSYNGSYSAEEIVLGSCDDSAVPYVLERMTGGGLSARPAVGVKVCDTRPLRFLAVLRNYLSTRSYEDFAALVRHEDVHQWLSERVSMKDPPTFLDREQIEHLQARIGEATAGIIPEAQELISAVEELCGPLLAGTKELPAWADAMAGTVSRLYYECRWNRFVPEEAALIEACEKLQGVLAALTELPAFAKTDAAQALTLVLQELQAEQTRPEPLTQAIEILGWLELQLDDAPALIVFGCNEGKLPTSLNADPFLPNSVRSRLGLLDNERRCARDMHALQAIVSSRQAHFISGRRNANGEPLSLSRLFLSCSGAELAARVTAFYRQAGRKKTRDDRRAGSAFSVPKPLPLSSPVTAMSVGSFADYLTCKYRFYLRHCLRLEALDDTLRELDPLGFGCLLHDVLADFGRSAEKGSTDAGTINEYLQNSLAARARKLFGRDALPAVRMQLKQMEMRLSYFAEWQAGRAAQGWEIRYVELPFEAGRLIWNGVSIKGRIDRADYNTADGSWAIFDYKTGENALIPAKEHGKPGAWKGLQLPLYWHLFRTLHPEAGSIGLGYINLCSDCDDSGGKLAEWESADLEDAKLCALEVIEAVKREEFWPPSDRVINDEFAAICGQDQLLSAGDEDD